ncbi:unnamed protein product [Closterium sp. Naga37s-1]|nr:unnamed protein product [Closterium sp. Naga37s-1]
MKLGAPWCPHLTLYQPQCRAAASGALPLTHHLACVADSIVQGGGEWGITSPFGSTLRITEFTEFVIKSRGIGLHTGPWAFPLLPAPPPRFLPSHLRRRQQNWTAHADREQDSNPSDSEHASGAAGGSGGGSAVAAAFVAVAGGLTPMEMLVWTARAVGGPSVVNKLGYFSLVDWGMLGEHNPTPQKQGQGGQQNQPVRVLVIRRDFFLTHPRMEDNGWVEKRVEGVNDLVGSLKQWAWERGGLRLLDAAEGVERMGSVVDGGNW